MCIAAALPIIATTMQAIGAIRQNQAQARSYNAQARQVAQQGQQEAQASGYEATRRKEALNRLTGEQITATAASGADLSGSPLDLIADSRREGLLDIAAVEYGSKLRQGNLAYEAAGLRYGAKLAKRSAKMAAASGIVRLGQNLFDAGAFGSSSSALPVGRSGGW